MDVALDGSDYDLSDRLRSGLSQQWSQDCHAGLHCVGGQQYLGNEEDAVSEVNADDPHAFNEGLVEDLCWPPVAAEQDVGAFCDLVGQTVVEVVVHLADQVLVRQARQIDLVFGCFFC